MDSTTLFTFLLHHPYATSVELLGSWDNFSRSYRMQRDRRRGHGHWTGCWSFENIICDGDLSQPYQKRNGAFKQGGTYWYYYRVDGDSEYYDPTIPATSACPLLPGQRMNVLDVPHEHTHEFRKGHMNPSTSHTWNPDDRYLEPRPAPKPALPHLITDPSGLSKSKIARGPSENIRYPMSADSYLYQQKSSVDGREVKSDVSPAPSLLKSALSTLKSPPSAMTPSQGGRGRSRTLPPSHERATRTHSPSQRELKISSPILIVGPDQERLKCLPIVQALKDSTTLLPVKHNSGSPPLSPLGSHPVMAEELSQFRVPKQRRVQLASHSRQNSEGQDSEGRSSCSSRDGSGSCAKTCPICRSAESIARRRSISTGRMREPSPLRKSMSIDVNSDASVVHVPEDIQEVDDESLRTPMVLPPDTMASSLQVPIPEDPLLRPHTSDCIPTQFPSSPLDKDLPALPSYLYPSPLRINQSFSSLPTDLADLPLDSLGPTSRFSAWTVSTSSFPPSPSSPLPSLPSSPTSSHAYHESPSSAPHTPQSLSSPTFSSIHGFSTDGRNTPRRLSDAVSLEEFNASDNRFPSPLSEDTQRSAEDQAHREMAYRQLTDYPHPTANSSLVDLLRAYDERAVEARSGTPTTVGGLGPPQPFVGVGKEGGLKGENGLGGMERRAMTAMEELMSEFEYLGGALL
ncbi:hypothetical protein P152DRAFT_57064 [Eremomyces bilateralis CBS 781.70]|uniref:Uncharacterized protein n=1 Tax=Eremomyces bilateralis CBS 781.70 TaxID=1392243 RepID=A0A6G1G0Y5_9PEZI|nr:uncharacterized protein P152DRAFT_57064 [Eremomyces bilateralis CBS 781.70]KAF1811469.1 hypothetical protein P152DRAFT_57064 [Eremomyces bilateralis CBS 781.70]